MPSRRSQGMLKLIRSHKKFANRIGNQWLLKIEPPVQAVAKFHMEGTSAKLISVLPFPALMVYPDQAAADDAVILHMHGGAYVSGGLLQCRALISPICASSGLRAFTFSYRLAPEYPYPAQLEDAWSAYQYLRKEGFSAKKIALVGESAGGNLALALALRLREMGEEMPGAIALLSPWVDLMQTGNSYKALKDVDATLDAEELMKSAIAFAGKEYFLSDARISPVYADFSGFPPVQIHCGTHEILLSDAELLEHQMLRSGVRVQLFRWAGMCHVFQAFGFEESKASNRQIGSFLKSYILKVGEKECSRKHLAER
mgnify:CR=1 FL=1